MSSGRRPGRWARAVKRGTRAGESRAGSRFRSREREVLGLRLHVREAGAGEPVLLLHGIGVSGRYFEPLGSELARARRVLIPDLPGWGASERRRRALGLEQLADVVDALLRREDGAPPVVANSFGCQVALALAERRPPSMGPLILIGPTVDPAYRGWLAQAARLTLDAVREPARLTPRLLADYARMGPRRFLATARAALADRPEQRLPHVESPLLVVRGERDATTTVAWARRCAALAPRGTFVAVPGAAHAAHVSHPALVADLVQAFLAERVDRVG